MARVYYNEIDPFAAQWLRNLIARGLIAPGDVDERRIEDVRPDDLVGYTQCHFFAGIGVWSYALRLAGWPDDRPVWTGSCPCQPFSAAGKGGGFADERHLWPVWYELIRACSPPVIFGEQVSSSIALGSARGPEVLALWERQAALRICENRIRQDISDRLQGMSERGRSRMVCESPVRHDIAGRSARCGGEGASSREGASLRSGCRVGSGEVGPRDMRGDGVAVQLADGSGVGYAIAGPYQAAGWIHESEHAPSSLCAERGLWGVGRGAPAEDCVCALERKKKAIERVIERNSRALADANGSSWVNALQADLEAARYAVGAVDLCAAGFGAPHIRQRLYWVADADETGFGEQRRAGLSADADTPLRDDAHGCGAARGLGHTSGEGSGRDAGAVPGAQGEVERGVRRITDESFAPGATRGFWRDADWLYCRDGKYRPVEPGTFPLVTGAPARVGRLRGYGNAINAEAARHFIEAYGEVTR